MDSLLLSALPSWGGSSSCTHSAGSGDDVPPVNRNQPVRAKSSDSEVSLMEFMRQFPDDKTCLDWLWLERYSPDGHMAFCPSCDKDRRFHRVNARPTYDCDSCGHHINPTAGTIFHKSSTSLHLWFYAMWIITS